MTDHVVLRGRHTNLRLTLYGRLDHSLSPSLPLPPPQGPQEPWSALIQGPFLHLPSPDDPHPPSTPPPVIKVAGPLPLTDGLPGYAIASMNRALEYFKQLDRSNKRIVANPPSGRLSGLFEVADAFAEAMQGRPESLSNMMSKSGGTDTHQFIAL